MKALLETIIGLPIPSSSLTEIVDNAGVITTTITETGYDLEYVAVAIIFTIVLISILVLINNCMKFCFSLFRR